MRGRYKKEKKDLRVKFGISINPRLNDLLLKEPVSRSKFIENLVKEYYERKIWWQRNNKRFRNWIQS